MLRTLLSALLLILFIGCSSTATSPETAENTPKAEVPTTYNGYKAWRDQYDPEAKAYADFKAWEGEYRRWQHINKGP